MSFSQYNTTEYWCGLHLFVTPVMIRSIIKRE